MFTMLNVFLSLFLFLHSAFFTMETDIKKIDLKLDEEEIAFHFFDLSDGEAMLMTSGKGETALVNTGSSESRNELKKRLSLYDITSIDDLILTGSDDKLAGNAAWLTNEYSVKKLFTTPFIQDELQLPVSFYPLKLNEQNEILSGLSIKMIFQPEENKAISFILNYGQNQLLFMGDVNHEIEKKLAADHELDSDILKVSAFGSAQTTSQFFLDHVDPDVAIVFKEKGKKPTDQVMERLQEAWIDIYLPYHIGLVIITCDKDFYDITKIRIEERNYS